MGKEYRSVEPRILERGVVKDCGEMLQYVGKGFYGATISLFRIPTAIRKLVNHQTFISRDEIQLLDEDRGQASYTAGAMGIILDALILTYSIKSAKDGNYNPLAVLGLTNALDGIFELGRLPQSRREHKKYKDLVMKLNDPVS